MNDKEVIKSVVEGNTQKYEKIVKKYQNRIISYIYNMIKDYQTAEDLTQEVFMKVYDALEKYNPDYKFSTWLYSIASNHTIDFIRKRSIDTTSLDEPLETKNGKLYSDPESDKLSPRDELRGREVGERLEEGMNQLKLKYREMLVLRHLNGLSYKEIAEVKDLPLGTVKTRIHRAREQLKENIKDTD